MQNLWAPWRMSYIGDENREKRDGCFFCHAWSETGRERENLLVMRGKTCFIMLNRFPYNSGHLMVAPVRHIGDMEEATEEEGAELWRLATLAKKTLRAALKPDGFNLGVNQGKVAGAGVLDHLHLHLVPRWNGDVNFMPVMADVRVVPQFLEETRDKLFPFFNP